MKDLNIDARSLSSSAQEEKRKLAIRLRKEEKLSYPKIAQLVGVHPEWLGEQGRCLSGGERKRLNIARAYLFRAELFLFDEPLEGLNTEQQQTLATAIQTLSQSASVIIASHIVPDNLTVQQTIVLSD